MLKKNSNNVKVSLGGKLADFNEKVMEAEYKIAELRNTIVELNETVKDLTNTNKSLKVEIEGLKNQKFDLEKELSTKSQHIYNLTSINKNLKNEKENLEKKITEINAINNILKNEIDELNSKIVNYEKHNMKYNKEINESEKIRGLYEKDLIMISDMNNKMAQKIQSLESVLGQKEKYIQILLKRKGNDIDTGSIVSGVSLGNQRNYSKNSFSSNVLLTDNNNSINKYNKDKSKVLTRKNSYNGKSILTNENNDLIKLDINLRNNSAKNNSNNENVNLFSFDYNRIKSISNPTTLQNYIINLVEEINKKEEKIQKLTKENCSLLTRIRNNTNK